MGSPASVLWLLVPAALIGAGCRARLPLPAESEAPALVVATEKPAVTSSAWAALLRDDPQPGRVGEVRIEPDRLRRVVRYNPPPRGFTSVGDFILSIRICAPGED